jgi:hypothetical protein
MQMGSKAIFHLEAFVAKFMSIYKRYASSCVCVCVCVDFNLLHICVLFLLQVFDQQHRWLRVRVADWTLLPRQIRTRNACSSCDYDWNVVLSLSLYGAKLLSK